MTVSILPVDAGVIRCICELDHDDNFTIQCERCNAWQHAGCVNIANEASAPENYVCPECTGSVTPTARQSAREQQKLILKQRARLQKLGAQRGSEEHEERKRRGRKRRSESESTAPVIVQNPEVYYLPSKKLIWSPAADRWRKANNTPLKDLPLVPRDTKPVQLQVSRRPVEGKTYNLGLNTLSLATPVALPANRFVCEVTGEVELRTEYASEPHNQYSRLGCPKFGVVFVPGLPLVIDCRRRGSQALFLRRGPQPNVRLVPSRASKSGELRVLLYTRSAVQAGDELLLGWHWPAAHPIRTAPQSPVLQTMFWLLGISRAECEPSASEENDEDWEILNAHAAPARPVTYAEMLRDSFVKRRRIEYSEGENASEPAEAPAIRIWVSPPQQPPAQKKKKLSLADYIKNRA